MPKDKVELDSTRSNPYITKGISKTLLTPCRQVGLSRKRRTPNSTSATRSSSKNETTSSNLEVTPVTSKVSSFEDTSESSTISEISQKSKKSVSKCLIADESSETSSGNFEVTPVTSKVVKVEDKSESNKTNKTSETAKKPKKSISKRLIVDGTSPSFSPSEELGKNVNSMKREDVSYRNIKIKTEDDDFSSDGSFSDLPLKKFKEKLNNDKDKGSKENKQRFIVEDEKSSSSQTSDENKNISIKKAKQDKIKTVKNKRLLIDDEDDDDFILKTDTSKMKKTEDKSVNKKKRLIIEDDDDDFSSISGVEKMEDSNEFPKSKSPLKGFPKKKEDPVSSVAEKNEKKLERVLSVEIEDINKKSVLAEIQTENNTKKEEKKSRLTLRRSLSTKKSSDDLQEKPVILKDCTVNLIDSSKIKSEHSYSSGLSEEKVNELESKVEAKRKIVEDLKQAEIYKRLHDVENLKKLTATWKDGCFSALKDLLPYLQAQSPPILKSLLKDLGAPDGFMTLSETSDLLDSLTF